MSDPVLLCSDPQAAPLAELLARYGMQLFQVPAASPIPGSFWGDSEAGLVGNRLFVRPDTPLHSALHEACHYICMDAQRRDALHTDAGGDVMEENGVCYLQIVLADQFPQVGRARMQQDMDSWGYSFRLGSARAWFEQDAEDALEWLLSHKILDNAHRPSWKLRQASNSQTDTREVIMIKKCLFPAAGYGTRFLPATKAMPKEILPIVNKPLIEYGVEEAMHAGMTEISMITGRGKRALADHFDISYELEHQISGTSKESALAGIREIMDKCTFAYTRQNEMKGLGDAILKGEPIIGHEPFGVILADDLCETEGEGVMSQMVKVYEKYRCSVVAIEEVPQEETYKYGVIAATPMEENIYMISNMVEKPDPAEAPSNLAIIGRYILTPDIFDILRETPPGKNGELQITDALLTQAKRNMVLAYKFKGKRFDCGSVDGYVEATNHYYELMKQQEG